MQWMAPLLLLACVSSCGGSGMETRREALRLAMAEGDQAKVSEAARAASEFEGTDPALDRMLGDALANHLFRGAEGLALLQANPLPEDPAWVAATADAALRAKDLVVLDGMMRAQGVQLNLDLPALEQVQRLSLQDRTVGHQLLVEVDRRCALVDQRPLLGRQEVDMPSSPSLERALRLLGATEVVVTRTHLVFSPKSPRERSFQCKTAWLPEGETSGIPSPLPPKGVLVAVTDGTIRGYLEIQSREGGEWVMASDDAQQAGRWLNAAYLLDAMLTAPDAEAKVLERYGSGLALPADQRVGPPKRTEKPLWED